MQTHQSGDENGTRTHTGKPQWISNTTSIHVISYQQRQPTLNERLRTHSRSQSCKQILTQNPCKVYNSMMQRDFHPLINKSRDLYVHSRPPHFSFRGESEE